MPLMGKFCYSSTNFMLLGMALAQYAGAPRTARRGSVGQTMHTLLIHAPLGKKHTHTPAPVPTRMRTRTRESTPNHTHARTHTKHREAEKKRKRVSLGRYEAVRKTRPKYECLLRGCWYADVFPCAFAIEGEVKAGPPQLS